MQRSDLLRLAADANVDPRTVARILRGETVRGDAARRVFDALEQRGIRLSDGAERDAAAGR